MNRKSKPRAREATVTIHLRFLERAGVSAELKGTVEEEIKKVIDAACRELEDIALVHFDGWHWEEE